MCNDSKVFQRVSWLISGSHACSVEIVFTSRVSVVLAHRTSHAWRVNARLWRREDSLQWATGHGSRCEMCGLSARNPCADPGFSVQRGFLWRLPMRSTRTKRISWPAPRPVPTVRSNAICALPIATAYWPRARRNTPRPANSVLIAATAASWQRP